MLKGLFGLQPKVATPKPRCATISQACVWFIATLVACHTFLATWSTCHRLNFLPNLATLVVAILLATFFVADTLCLSLVVAKLVMNEVQPWSLLDSTCGRIWWNVDDIQRPVVLGFAIFVPSDWLHPTTNFQSFSHTIQGVQIQMCRSVAMDPKYIYLVECTLNTLSIYFSLTFRSHATKPHKLHGCPHIILFILR